MQRCANLFRIVSGIWRPVASDLFRPVAIALPGIKCRIDTNASTARCGRFRNPLTILLPAIGIVSSRFVRAHGVVGLLGFRVGIRTVLVSPFKIFAIWHYIALINPCYQMLRVERANSQELHHSADWHFLHNFHALTLRFYLMGRNTENPVRRHLTISCRADSRSGNAITGLIVSAGDFHALVRDERSQQFIQQ
jgi:hypothetical protein